MPRLSSAAARLLGLGLSALLVVAGLLVSSTSATADGARLVDPMAGAPAAGDCFALTLKQAYARAVTEDPVSCTGKHTVRVVAVGQLPDDVAWADEQDVWDAVAKVCDPAGQKVTGRMPLSYRTLWGNYWFLPTEAQQDDGARWFTCGVALSTGAKLLPLPKGPLPRAKKNPADSIARCVSRANTYVPCSAPHVYRASHTFLKKAAGNEKRLKKAIAEAANETCPRRVKRWTGVYSGYPITKTQVVIACYTKTTR